MKIKGELNQKLAKQILEDERTKPSHKHDISVYQYELGCMERVATLDENS